MSRGRPRAGKHMGGTARGEGLNETHVRTLMMKDPPAKHNAAMYPYVFSHTKKYTTGSVSTYSCISTEIVHTES